MSRFTGGVFLISGGARGLGAAQARRLVSEGGRVVIGDVLIQEGRQLAAELGDACSFKPLDVTTFLGMRAAVSAFERNGGGAIVNISSTAGLRAAPNAIAYTASKWAVRGMTKAAALELADRNIRVNSVHPGPIDTDMLRVRGEAENRQRTQRIPMKRFGTPAEIAGLVLFLLSDESRYMTGSEVAMDGGISL